MKIYMLFLLMHINVCIFSQQIQFDEDIYINNKVGYLGALIALNNNKFVVIGYYADDLAQKKEICSQIVNLSNKNESKIIQVNTADVSYWSFGLSGTAIDNNQFVVCWENSVDGSGSGISGQIISDTGKKEGPEFLVNTYINDSQNNPVVTRLRNGGFVVCWDSMDQDGSSCGIFGQKFDGNGNKIGPEFQVNLGTTSVQQGPSMNASENGGFFVCWQDLRYGNESDYEIFGQFFDKSGNKYLDEFRINSTTNGRQICPQVFGVNFNDVIVGWANEPYMFDDSKLTVQIYNESGIKKGDEIIINDEYLGKFQAMMINQDSILIGWDQANLQSDYTGTHGQLLDSLGNKMGKEFVLWTDQSQNQVALMDNNYIVCGYAGGRIKCKLLPRYLGIRSISPFNLLSPSNDLSVHTTNKVCIWQNASRESVYWPWEIHYKVFIDENPEFSSSHIIEQDQDTTLILQNLQPGTTYFWKVLAKNIAGDSLWSSNTSAFFVMHDATSGVEEKCAASPKEFMLHQNYPNPFNPETTIMFELPSTRMVLISIYDISGKPVTVLMHESRPAGSHSMQWDGKDSEGNAVPSGIYVCRMEVCSAEGSRFTQSVKMGLVR